MHDEGEWAYEALSELVTQSEEATVLADPSGVFLLANKGASDIVGVPAEQMDGLRVDSFGRETMHEFQRIAVDAVVANRVEVTCAPGASVEVGGATFTWERDVPAPRGRPADASHAVTP